MLILVQLCSHLGQRAGPPDTSLEENHPMIMLSKFGLPPRWPLQCSCVVIESSFDRGERIQAPGSLWFLIEPNMWKCCNVGLYMCCCRKSSYH
jgi:hypothetical protein